MDDDRAVTVTGEYDDGEGNEQAGQQRRDRPAVYSKFRPTAQRQAAV